MMNIRPIDALKKSRALKEAEEERIRNQCEAQRNWCFEFSGLPSIELSPEDFQKCEDYAERRRKKDNGFSHYENRGQTDILSMLKHRGS